jgi:hypothetical protein
MIEEFVEENFKHVLILSSDDYKNTFAEFLSNRIFPIVGFYEIVSIRIGEFAEHWSFDSQKKGNGWELKAENDKIDYSKINLVIVLNAVSKDAYHFKNDAYHFKNASDATLVKLCL